MAEREYHKKSNTVQLPGLPLPLRGSSDPPCGNIVSVAAEAARIAAALPKERPAELKRMVSGGDGSAEDEEKFWEEFAKSIYRVAVAVWEHNRHVRDAVCGVTFALIEEDARDIDIEVFVKTSGSARRTLVGREAGAGYCMWMRDIDKRRVRAYGENMLLITIGLKNWAEKRPIRGYFVVNYNRP